MSTTINRAPFNGLVDDDGSNTVGSIWNKNAIKNVLLDPIDQALADLQTAVTPPAAPAWVAVPYSAANFVGGPGLTWTVDAGDVLRFSYLLVNKTMTVSVWLNTTTISGSGGDLRVTIPLGKLSAGYCVGAAASGTGFDTGVVFSTTGASYLSVNRNLQAPYTAATNAITVAFTFTFEVQ